MNLLIVTVIALTVLPFVTAAVVVAETANLKEEN